MGDDAESRMICTRCEQEYDEVTEPYGSIWQMCPDCNAEYMRQEAEFMELNLSSRLWEEAWGWEDLEEVR